MVFVVSFFGTIYIMTLRSPPSWHPFITAYLLLSYLLRWIYAIVIIPKPPSLLSHTSSIAITRLRHWCLHIPIYLSLLSMLFHIFSAILVEHFLRLCTCLPYPLSHISTTSLSSSQVSVKVLIKLSSIVLCPSPLFLSMFLNLCHLSPVSISIITKSLPQLSSSNQPSPLPLLFYPMSLSYPLLPHLYLHVLFIASDPLCTCSNIYWLIKSDWLILDQLSQLYSIFCFSVACNLSLKTLPVLSISPYSSVYYNIEVVNNVHIDFIVILITRI